jgi:hypothetical protein
MHDAVVPGLSADPPILRGITLRRIPLFGPLESFVVGAFAEPLSGAVQRFEGSPSPRRL